jgi:hypothetical protein
MMPYIDNIEISPNSSWNLQIPWQILRNVEGNAEQKIIRNDIYIGSCLKSVFNLFSRQISTPALQNVSLN